MEARFAVEVAVVIEKGQFMILHRFLNGDELKRYDKAIIVSFSGKRNVLSTAAHNGGYKENLKYVFNHDCKVNGKKDTPLKADTYSEHMVILARELGLNPDHSCGLTTAADMDHVSIKYETYGDTTVTAVVTAGIDENGGRVGDPAFFHESEHESHPISGTINMMLFVDANLSESTLVRALITCTEAKTAALQELIAPSCYSSGIATGSGTDGVIIVSNADSKVNLTWAGKHAKLGELIGSTVMSAVKEALFHQTGLGTERQFNIFSRIGRYGITANRFYSRFQGDSIDRLAVRKDAVVFTSLYVHLLDQLQWELIEPRDAVSAGNALLKAMGIKAIDIKKSDDVNGTLKAMLKAYENGIFHLTKTSPSDK